MKICCVAEDIPSQYFVMAYMGKNVKRVGICIYTTEDSLSCALEINTIFKSTIL